MGVGGITLEPTAVQVAGDVADITYNVKFAGNQAYGNQKGEVRRRGEGWVVPNSTSCEFMAAARNPCR